MLEMPELIASDADAYVELAIGLAQSPERRRTLKERIARNKHGLYRDPAAIDGLAAYLENAAGRRPS